MNIHDVDHRLEIPEKTFVNPFGIIMVPTPVLRGNDSGRGIVVAEENCANRVVANSLCVRNIALV